MSPAWNKLQASAERLRGVHLRELLQSEQRFDKLSFNAAHLLLDSRCARAGAHCAAVMR